MVGPSQVGLIKKAWRHPDAESLYIEEIDVGEEQPRQVGARPCGMMALALGRKTVHLQIGLSSFRAPETDNGGDFVFPPMILALPRAEPAACCMCACRSTGSGQIYIHG